MAVIHVLDQHTAELIAAGEVVERPASVVKELLENSIDAGATQVTVELERGGISLIRISDNGSGIDTEYVPTAFIRHATSKIRTEEDLDSIHTLGFRGEALASIASVARVQLLTRTEDEEFAALYRIEGGQELGLETAARPQGTTIEVRDLFYNTPARMKFLKKDATEGTYVSEVVSRIALSHPEVAIRFVRDGKQQFATAGDGSLRSAAYAVLGREFARDLLELEPAGEGPYRLSGLLTAPRGCRASRSMQFFFINGRFVKNRTMMAALENAYKGTLMQGKFPGCVLNLEMPPQLVDVNVHPAKTEVRFAREGDVFDAVYRAVKTVVTRPAAGERVFSFAQSGAKPGAAVQAPQKPAAAPVPAPAKQAAPAVQPAPRPAAAVSVAAPSARAVETMRQINEMFAGASQLRSRPVGADPETPVYTVRSEQELSLPVEEMPPAGPAEPERAEPPATQPEMPREEPQTEPPKPAPVQAAEQITMEPEPEIEPLRYVGEVFRTYIITQRGDEMCLIDKHAAHERLLYEKLAAEYGRVSSQMLLAPVTVRLSAEEKQAVLEHQQLLQDAGLEAEDFGDRTVLVRAVPADVPPNDVEELLVELADRLAAGSRDAVSEKTEWVLHSIACRAAIKAGDKSDAAQLLHLAQEILAGKVPPFCPHGRPVVLKLTKKELEKQFGRLG